MEAHPMYGSAIMVMQMDDYTWEFLEKLDKSLDQTLRGMPVDEMTVDGKASLPLRSIAEKVNALFRYLNETVRIGKELAEGNHGGKSPSDGNGIAAPLGEVQSEYLRLCESINDILKGKIVSPEEGDGELSRAVNRLAKRVTEVSSNAGRGTGPDWSVDGGHPVFAPSTDPLTGTLSRKAGLELLKFLQEKEMGGTHCIAFVDIEGLEAVNAKYGHSEGDEYIRAVAEVLKASSRASETIIRYGGDEFMILFTDCSLDLANKILMRMRDNLEKSSPGLKKTYKMSFSYGVNILEADEKEDSNSKEDETMLINKPQKKRRARMVPMEGEVN